MLISTLRLLILRGLWALSLPVAYFATVMALPCFLKGFSALSPYSVCFQGFFRSYIAP
jgi:hypothetical protein